MKKIPDFVKVPLPDLKHLFTHNDEDITAVANQLLNFFCEQHINPAIGLCGMQVLVERLIPFLMKDAPTLKEARTFMSDAMQMFLSATVMPAEAIIKDKFSDEIAEEKKQEPQSSEGWASSSIGHC